MGMPLSWVGPVIRPVGVAQRTRNSTAPWTFLRVLAARGRVAVGQERRARQARHGDRVGLAAAGDPRAVVGLLGGEIIEPLDDGPERLRA